MAMSCSDYIERFSAFLDGDASSEELSAFEAHLEACAACRRYRAVVEHGAAVLRSLPSPPLREDFEPRLRHRLYHVDDERSLAAHQSATPALTVVGIAILLTALAWAPVLRDGTPDIRLEAIVIDRAPAARSPIRPTGVMPLGTYGTKTPADLAAGLWEETLLYDYSALSQRYNQRARVRRVSDTER
jgi:anti-sigma factor RsiW